MPTCPHARQVIHVMARPHARPPVDVLSAYMHLGPSRSCPDRVPISMALQFFWCPRDLLNLDPSPSIEPTQAHIKTGTFNPGPTPLGHIHERHTCTQAWANAHEHWWTGYACMTCTYGMHTRRV